MSRAATAPPTPIALLGVARGPFLLLPVTLVAVGTGAAVYLGGQSWTAALLAMLGMIGVHVAVNAFNEASDYRTGIDLKTERTPFSGGSGTLPAGHLRPGAAVRLGIVGGALGVGVGTYFLTVVGWKLLPILAVGAVATFAYTEFLARGYVGELFAGLGLGALPVIGTTLVQTGSYEPVAVAAALPAFFMTFNLLLLNEFPDEGPDREGGRRNLVLLLGRRRGALLHAAFSLMVPVTLLAAAATGRLPALAAVAILPSMIFLAGPLRWAFREPESAVPLPALGANVIWNLSTNVVLAAALVLA